MKRIWNFMKTEKFGHALGMSLVLIIWFAVMAWAGTVDHSMYTN